VPPTFGLAIFLASPLVISVPPTGRTLTQVR
jgi:hypothetical protein